MPHADLQDAIGASGDIIGTQVESGLARSVDADLTALEADLTLASIDATAPTKRNPMWGTALVWTVVPGRYRCKLRLDGRLPRQADGPSPLDALAFAWLGTRKGSQRQFWTHEGKSNGNVPTGFALLRGQARPKGKATRVAEANERLAYANRKDRRNARRLRLYMQAKIMAKLPEIELEYGQGNLSITLEHVNERYMNVGQTFVPTVEAQPMPYPKGK